MSNSKSEDTPKKTPEGAFSETFGLNTTDYTAVRQVLLDLLTEYREMDFPANPELLKLHIDAAVDKLVIPEPPQDTSLTEITAEYFMATDPDRVALQRKVLAWHKAERAKACKQAREKLFEQIRSAIEGQEVDVEATRERMEELGASENEILNMEIEADDTKEILDGVREALTRLELSNNLKEGI